MKTRSESLDKGDILAMARDFESAMVKDCRDNKHACEANNDACNIIDPDRFLKFDLRGIAFLCGMFEAFYLLVGDPDDVHDSTDWPITAFLSGRVAIQSSDQSAPDGALMLLSQATAPEMSFWVLAGLRSGAAFLAGERPDQGNMLTLFDVIPDEPLANIIRGKT